MYTCDVHTLMKIQEGKEMCTYYRGFRDMYTFGVHTLMESQEGKEMCTCQDVHGVYINGVWGYT